MPAQVPFFVRRLSLVLSISVWRLSQLHYSRLFVHVLQPYPAFFQYLLIIIISAEGTFILISHRNVTFPMFVTLLERTQLLCHFFNSSNPAPYLLITMVLVRAQKSSDYNATQTTAEVGWQELKMEKSRLWLENYLLLVLLFWFIVNMVISTGFVRATCNTFLRSL